MRVSIREKDDFSRVLRRDGEPVKAEHLVFDDGRELKVLATVLPALKLYVVENDDPELGDEERELAENNLFIVVDEDDNFIGETNRASLDEEILFSIEEMFFKTGEIEGKNKIRMNEQFSFLMDTELLT